MSRLVESIKGMGRKEDLILNAVCLLMALVFLGFAAGNFVWAGDFLTIDSLFMASVFLLLAIVFLISPILWLHTNGYFKRLVGAGSDIEPVELVPVHFEGTTKLFLSILVWLLVLTGVEVVLAYFEVPIHLMLTILIGLSLVKAALIIAYFMHLRFERLSLVLTLIPALVVCLCLLLIFFPDSFRSKSLRYDVTAAQPEAK